jgi:hypothetical protein
MWIYITAGLVLAFGFMAFTGAPYLPSKRKDIERALTELYELGVKDHLVDMGAGDGVVLRVASSLGAKATGYEINPVIAYIARFLSRNDSHVKVYVANLWRVEFPDDTTVVYVFGDTRDIKKMYKKVEEQAARIGRPLYLISYGFAVPGCETVKQVGASNLYRVEPLRKQKAQV